MKRGKRTVQKSDSTLFVAMAKKFGSFTRGQILAAVTVIAGIILVVLLLRSDETPTNDIAAAPTNTPAPGTEDRATKVEIPEIKGANRPPVIAAVILSPNVVLPGTPVRVEVKATDPDHDNLHFDYIWKINGQVVAEQRGEEFDTNGLRKGDLITVSVIPNDGKESGHPLESNGIVIQNFPPEITSMPAAGVSSGFFKYQVRAQDPDNEPLLFSLEGAPPGMTVDSTGLIQWNVPQGLHGKQQVRVIVSDGSASCFQTFNLNLGQQ